MRIKGSLILTLSYCSLYFSTNNAYRIMNFCCCKLVYYVILSGELTVKNFSNAKKSHGLRYGIKVKSEMIKEWWIRFTKNIEKMMKSEKISLIERVCEVKLDGLYLHGSLRASMLLSAVANPLIRFSFNSDMSCLL